MPPVAEERTRVASRPVADLIAVAIRPVAANLRLRREDTRVEHAGVARAEVEVVALSRVQAMHALVGCLVAIARRAGASTRACKARAIGAGRTGIVVIRTTLPALRVVRTYLLIVQTPVALLADRRRSDDALVVPVTRFGAIAELAVVAVVINLALHARRPRIIAITEALPAGAAIRVGRTGSAGR